MWDSQFGHIEVAPDINIHGAVIVLHGLCFNATRFDDASIVYLE
jgi:hypothetical protein